MDRDDIFKHLERIRTVSTKIIEKVEQNRIVVACPPKTGPLFKLEI